MKRLFRILGVCTLVLSMTVLPVYGKSAAELKREQQAVKGTTKDVQIKLNETKELKNEVLAEVDLLDEEINKVSDDLDAINEELDKTISILDKTEVDLKNAEDSKIKQYDLLKKRMRFMYEYGNIGYLQIALKATSVGDFLNRLEYINRIIKYDHDLVNKLIKSEELIKTKMEETAKQKRAIEVLATQQTDKKQTLEKMVDNKYETVTKLTQDELKFEKQMKDLADADKKIEKLIKEAQAKAAAAAKSSSQTVYKGGKIGWPVPSSSDITSYYGYRIHPISKKRAFHSGIDIGAKYGASIVAAEGGTVISSGWMSSYGNTVIIEHGNGMSTLYAHNSSLLVKVGATVKRGQAIAKAGSTGYSTGTHLHFEVRINGATKNALDYLK